MAASRRRLTVVVAVLAGLALVGGLAVRLGCGETGEPIPRAADAGVGGAPGGGEVTAVGARPLPGGIGAAGMTRISGTVRDLTRAPVADVEVRFTGPDGESSATTDRSGRYRVGLASGRYQVRAVADHAVSFERLYLAVPAGLEVDGVDLEVIWTARVSGRVIDGQGRPVDGADIGSLTWVHDDRIADDDIAPLGGGASGAGGSYAIVVPAGEVRVMASHESGVGSTRLRGVAPGSAVTGVEIAIAAGGGDAGVVDLVDQTRIRALVDGDAGAGVSGSIAGVVRGPSGPLSVFDVQLRMAEQLRFLSADGSYRIDGVLPGQRELTISAPGLAPAASKLLVVAGTVADGSATLVAGAGIEGTVTSATTGRPIAGVQLTMTTGQDSAFAHTDAAGRYAVVDIAAGRRGLEARRPGFVGKILPGLLLEAGKTVRHDLALEPVAEGAAGEVELAGIGVSISMQADPCRIVGLVPGGPAELAELRTGDLIVEIDGRPVAGWSFPDVVEAIRGVVGTVVRLEIVRGQERFRRDVVRASIRYREQ